MRAAVTFLLFAGAAALVASRSEYLSAKHKLTLLETEQLPRGSQVSLSPAELNAYIEGELSTVVPDGVRNARLQLGNGTAQGSALVNFLKLRRAKTGQQPGWVAQKLLDGEKTVAVTAKVNSGGGRATILLERVEVSGFALSGSALDFVIRTFFLPWFPDAKFGQPFVLLHRVERIELRPAEVRVFLAK